MYQFHLASQYPINHHCSLLSQRSNEISRLISMIRRCHINSPLRKHKKQTIRNILVEIVINTSCTKTNYIIHKNKDNIKINATCDSSEINIDFTLEVGFLDCCSMSIRWVLCKYESFIYTSNSTIDFIKVAAIYVNSNGLHAQSENIL